MTYLNVKKNFVWMMVILIFSFRTFSNSIPLLHASCAETFLSSANDENSNTNFLLRYLGELYEIGALNIEDLKRFLEHLEQGEIINPIDSEKTHSNPNATIQQTAIDDFLLEGNLRIKDLIQWVSSKLESEFQIQTARSDISIHTESTHYPMVFYPVKIPRRIWGISLPHFIRQPSIIEVASTQLTEMQWYEVMGDVVNQDKVRFLHQTERSPRNQANGVYVENRKGEKILIYPNHPVTEISIWSALVFANTLSIKNNLEPAYDLSAMNFIENTLASDGSLQTTYNLDFDKFLIFNPKSNGYRLPSRLERSYLIGITYIPWIGKLLTSKRFDYNCTNAWLANNSRRKIREVALRDSTIIDNYPFFDLIGNTLELVQIFNKVGIKKKKINQVELAYVNFYANGGDFRTYKGCLLLQLGYSYANPQMSFHRLIHRDVGYRFVRTVKP